MKKGKIIFVAYQSKVAGGEMVLINLARAALEADWQVGVVIPERGPIEDYLKGCLILEQKLGSTIHLPSVRKLRNIMSQQRPCIVHTHGLLRNLPARLARPGLKDVVLINSVHMSRNLAGGGHLPGLALKARCLCYRLYDNRSAFLSDWIVAVGESVRRDLIAQGISHPGLMTIPNGIAAPETLARPEARREILRQTGFPEDSFITGGLSRLSHQKDIPTFIRTAQNLCSRQPRAGVVLYGDGEYLDRARSMVEEAGMQKRIILAGHVKDAQQLLPGLDAFLLTSLWEGLPLAIMEALAAGVPVVATACPGNLEALGELSSDCSAAIGDDRGLAAKLQRLAEEPDFAAAVATRGRDRFQREYTLENMTRRHLELYDLAWRKLG
ncbi:MAG: glycosyltransferase [Planctomycetes bacterium]|nr:glycosyltransferase [Planctomycetota bacterium]